MNQFIPKKQRKHMLFVPADKPAMYRDVIIYKPDTIMFDLEDAIAFSEKDSTRELLKQLLPAYNYNQYNIEVAVRVNGLETPWFEADLAAVVEARANMVRLPKVETKDDIIRAATLLSKFEAQYKLDYKLSIFVAIESAKGVLNALEIAQASDRIVGIALGGMDYILDLKATKTAERTELLYARQHLVHVARATGINVFDVVYPNVNNRDGFIQEFTFAKSLGFDGKSVIHPSQIHMINEIYQPTRDQVEYALGMIRAFKDNQAKGLGVFQYKGQMIDKPIVEKAQETIDLAMEFNLLKAGDLDGIK